MEPAPIPVETLLAHREWVRGVARAVVRDPNAADDLEQETWLAALRTPPRTESSLRGWFGAVVRSRARRAGRSESRRGTREAAAARPESTQSAADLAEIADTHRRVVAAVVELAEPYRQTILLRYFEGLAVEDVAARMGTPLDTTRSRISRGLAKLRERLERELGTDARPWHLALVPLIGGTREPVAGAGVGAAAAGGGVLVATKMAWAAGAALVIVGLGALAETKWSVAASAPVVVAVAPVVVPVLPPVPPEEENAKSVVSPTPAPSAEVPRQDPPPPVAVVDTSIRARLAATKLTIDWTAIPFADAVADLAEKTGVPMGISVELADRLDDDVVISRLRLEDVSGATALKLIGNLTSFEAVTEATRVVFVPNGVTRNPVLPVIVPPKPDPNAPKTLTLCGYVSDHHANRIPHASIVVAGSSPRRTIAETGDDGSFSVELVRPFPRIYADCPGLVPSGIVTVKGAYGTTFKARLELGSGGAIVEGHVVDEQGRDVAGVTVTLTAVDAASVAAERERAVTSTPTRQSSQTVKTDAAGRFRGAAMRPGLFEVVALAKRTEVTGTAQVTTFLPSGRELVAVGLAETRQVGIRLGIGGQRIRGTLRDEKGRPVAGAVVDARAGRSLTTADGSFSVTLDAARVSLGTASCTVSFTTQDGRRMERWVYVEPGIDLRVDPRIVPKWRIAGRVTDESGGRTTIVDRVALEPVLPWSGWWFRARSPLALKPDGAFAFDDVEPGRYRVVAYGIISGAWAMALGASEEIAEPRSDFVFQIPKAWQPKGSLTARITDESGSPVENAVIALQSPQDRTSVSFRSDASGFAKRLVVPAGRYRTYVLRYDAVGIIDIGFREIGASAQDLGTIAFAKAGAARMTWTATGDVDPHAVYGSIEFLLSDGWPVAAVRSFVFDGTEPVAWTLSPGRYRLRASGPNVQRVEREFVVTSGGVSEIDVPLRAAKQRLIALAFPMGTPAVGRIRVTDAAGALVHQQDLLASEFITPLLPGRYRVDVDVTETITVHGTLDVPADNAPETFDVPLR